MSLSKLPFLFVLVFMISFHGYSQYLGSPKLSGVGLPYFNTEVFPTFTEDGTQRIVRVYVQMLNDDVTFVNADTCYLAEVQIDVYITNSNQEFVFNRTFTEEIVAKTFEETNSRKIVNVFSTEIPLDSGRYESVVTVLDKNTGKQINRKVFFKLPSLSKLPFLVSEILMFDEFEEDSTGRITTFTPNLTGNFSSGSRFVYLHFDTYIRDMENDSLRIRYVIRDANNYINQKNEYVLQGNNFRKHFIRLSRHQFERARYSIEVIVTLGKYQYKVDKFFSFFWTISPNSPQDLDLAMRQLEYIADRDSINFYLKQGLDAKKKYFEKFWKEMDPNPETNKNELMDEYYRRVNYANQSFSSMSQEGWLTDMGRIFIKFGQPDDIERHPFEMNTYPYEIWRYYSLRKVFLFIDRLGFGDYYLHPSYLDEEYN